MSNQKQEPNEERKPMDKEWKIKEGETPPTWGEVRDFARQAYDAAFNSPGILRIRGARKNC